MSTTESRARGPPPRHSKLWLAIARLLHARQQDELLVHTILSKAQAPHFLSEPVEIVRRSVGWVGGFYLIRHTEWPAGHVISRAVTCEEEGVFHQAVDRFPPLVTMSAPRIPRMPGEVDSLGTVSVQWKTIRNHQFKRSFLLTKCTAGRVGR